MPSLAPLRILVEVRCTACGASTPFPVLLRPCRDRGDGSVPLRVVVEPLERIVLAEWAASHRGPVRSRSASADGRPRGRRGPPTRTP